MLNSWSVCFVKSRSMFEDIFDVESKALVHFDFQEVDSFFDHFSRFCLDKFHEICTVPVKIGICFLQDIVFFWAPHDVAILVRVVLVICIDLGIVVEPVQHGDFWTVLIRQLLYRIFIWRYEIHDIRLFDFLTLFWCYFIFPVWFLICMFLFDWRMFWSWWFIIQKIFCIILCIDCFFQ